MKNEIEQKVFEKMKAKDFGESMCNETKLNVLKWTMQQLRKYAVSGRSEQLNCDHEWRVDKFDCYGFPAEKYCDKCCKNEAV